MGKSHVAGLSCLFMVSNDKKGLCDCSHAEDMGSCFVGLGVGVVLVVLTVYRMLSVCLSVCLEFIVTLVFFHTKIPMKYK